MTDTPRNWFDDAMHEAAHSYRAVPEPPLDEMWAEIELAHFEGRGRHHRWQRRLRVWVLPAAGIAAAFLVGVGIGRYVVPARGWTGALAPGGTAAANALETVVTADTEAGIAASVSGPYEAVTTEYFGETAALLVALPTEGRGGRADARFVAQAEELLTTTRLLIDSPAAADPELRGLLDDLELVLAQIARMRTTRDSAELDLIAGALEQHDVIPRLRSAAAVYAGLDN